jgi:PhnB protein
MDDKAQGNISIIGGRRMQRSMMQAYVWESDKAVELYQRAFDAELVSSFPQPDGTFFHAELSVFGQILAIAEARKDEARATGNTMQFCLHFGEGKEETVQKAYDVLKDGATILYPLGSCEYSVLMVDLIDKFGVRWCLFV